MHQPRAIAADVEILGRPVDPFGRGYCRIERRAVVGELDDDAVWLSADGNGGSIGVAMRDGVEKQLFEAKTNGEFSLFAESQSLA